MIKLDAAYQNGVYLLLNLYNNMLPAGHPDNVANTQTFVNAAKNHPALFGYMIMDEPFINSIDKEATYGYLKNSYKIIRDLDSAHPVYVVECMEADFEKASNCADIFAIDMYPTNLASMPDRTYSTTKTAVEAVNSKKPVYHILQAYNLSGSYEPSSNDIRHMAYQAFFGGASNIGYYPVCDSDSIMWETGLYDGVVSFAALEQQNAIKAFVTGENEVVCKVIDEDGICYIAYESRTDVYVAAINKSTTGKSVTLNVGISGTVTAVNGGSLSDTSISGSNLTITLSGLQAACYKVSPM